MHDLKACCFHELDCICVGLNTGGSLQDFKKLIFFPCFFKSTIWSGKLYFKSMSTNYTQIPPSSSSLTIFNYLFLKKY